MIKASNQATKSSLSLCVMDGSPCMPYFSELNPFYGGNFFSLLQYPSTTQHTSMQYFVVHIPIVQYVPMLPNWLCTCTMIVHTHLRWKQFVFRVLQINRVPREQVQIGCAGSYQVHMYLLFYIFSLFIEGQLSLKCSQGLEFSCKSKQESVQNSDN